MAATVQAFRAFAARPWATHSTNYAIVTTRSRSWPRRKFATGVCSTAWGTPCSPWSHSKGCIDRYPYVSPPYYGALFVGDGVSLPIPPQFGCDECILTHITLYLNQKGGKSRAKLVGSSWYLTPLLWDTPKAPCKGPQVLQHMCVLHRIDQ